ncbi:MAG: hypothetical protein J0L78_13970 [Planctomycetes bacterium]|nr:hypothetical protein [Planctomycetota bacterium]
MDHATGFSTGRHRRTIFAASFLAPAFFLALALPLIFNGLNRGRGAADSLNYHEKAIRTFASQFPHPDLSDYLSATTPGYHLLLSLVARFISDQRLHLQLASAALSALLIATLASACAWRMRRAMSPFGVLAVCLPFLCSIYVLSSGVWLLPDNAAWFALLGVLLLALRRSQHFGVFVAAGLLMVVLVLTRQIHIWAAGVIWIGAWLGAGAARSESPLFSRHDIGGRTIPRITRTTLAFLLTLPAFAVLFYFYKLWGGLTPPSFKPMHGARIQWAGPALDLSLLAVAGCFYFEFWRAAFGKLTREQPVLLVAVAAGGFLLAVLPNTTHDPASGRVTGIFHAVKALPDIADHTSILFPPLAALGAVILFSFLRAMNPRARWVMLGALLGFSIANSVNPQLWQRYHEPFILMWIILASSLAVWGGSAAKPGRLAVIGPLALAALLAFVSYRGIFHERVATDAHFTPGNVEPAALSPSQSRSDHPIGPRDFATLR